VKRLSCGPQGEKNSKKKGGVQKGLAPKELNSIGRVDEIEGALGELQKVNQTMEGNGGDQRLGNLEGAPQWSGEEGEVERKWAFQEEMSEKPKKEEGEVPNGKRKATPWDLQKTEYKSKGS